MGLVEGHMYATEFPGLLEKESQVLCCFLQSAFFRAPSRLPAVAGWQPDIGEMTGEVTGYKLTAKVWWLAGGGFISFFGGQQTSFSICTWAIGKSNVCKLSLCGHYCATWTRPLLLKIKPFQKIVMLPRTNEKSIQMPLSSAPASLTSAANTNHSKPDQTGLF